MVQNKQAQFKEDLKQLMDTDELVLLLSKAVKKGKDKSSTREIVLDYATQEIEINAAFAKDVVVQMYKHIIRLEREKAWLISQCVKA